MNNSRDKLIFNNELQNGFPEVQEQGKEISPTPILQVLEVQGNAIEQENKRVESKI